MTPTDRANLTLDSFGGTRGPIAARPRATTTVADRWALARLQRALEPARIRLVLWDGACQYRSPLAPVSTVELHDRATLFQLLWNRDVAFGEAYSAGRLDVHGDLLSSLEMLYRARSRRPVRGRPHPSLLRRTTPHRSRHDVHHHYDLGNDFYASWLDDEMVYTCAYFREPDMTLEEAQHAKMRHVCRKLRLRPGDRVVEAGCGWGSLALHMARHHGVHVTAYNISREQIRYARERARREGLTDRVEFVEDDYRTVEGRFDVFVSIGMLEHVGLTQFRTLGEVIDRTLAPESGRGLLHFIGRDFVHPLNAWIRKRIFPGGYPPTLAQVTRRILEPNGFSVLDVENLRLHYARTLQHWRARFDGSAASTAAAFDESFVRTWRLYLAGSQAAFTTGWMQLFQVSFARNQNNDVAWTRPV